MNQTLLFVIGVAVFTITVCATLNYGYILFNRDYQADLARQPVDTDQPDTQEVGPESGPGFLA
jgi:hypothetical protein